MALQVDDLRVYYRSLAGDVRAVDGVSLEIADGEIMGLAGESGCGKSTLGKALIKLDTRMRWVGGHVALDGAELRVWDDAVMNDHRYRDVSLVPQYAMSALNPTRKVGRMARELLESRGIAFGPVRPELERRLELVGLDPGVLGMYPIEMSGGMKQRFVLVLSTLLNPSLLIADEITSALDVSTQKAVAEMLVGFRDRGFVKSAMVITHDLSILAQVASTILIMYAGKLAEKASTETIVDEPRHPYTRMLLGTLPEVGVRFAERRLDGIKGRPPSLLDPPPGCRFRDRCPLATPRCAAEPPYRSCGDGRLVACWEAASC
jgi:peptide/nickel transport system ATP-binding protein